MTWSARGEIAYARYDSGGPEEIFVMRADGTRRPRQATHDGGNINARLTRLVWANGGRRLLYFRAICDE